MIGPTPSAPQGPRKRKTSQGPKSKNFKAPKAAKGSEPSGFPKEGKVMEALVTPGDMERVLKMLRDQELLDWLDKCAGSIHLKGGTISLNFGGSNRPAREVLANAASSLRHLVFEEQG